MKITHPAVASPVLQLVRTLELDLRFGENGWTTRIELFQDTEREDRFRCRVWELEMFRLTPTSPMDENGQPEHVCDDVLMVHRGIPRGEVASLMHETFTAPGVEAALEMVMTDLKNFLEHVTRIKAT
ncbi:MAG TPA: hypothetical protein VK388_14275 [Pyrinomonadaceae bacterium]|nr:hypothetical protein [Pyrinomonadaceae bacterium]